jgi:hypothetical protein
MPKFGLWKEKTLFAEGFGVQHPMLQPRHYAYLLLFIATLAAPCRAQNGDPALIDAGLRY